MFVGHLAVAFAAKKAAPDVNLGWLMAGVTGLDLVWPVLVLAGIEHVRIVPGATAFTPLVFDWYPWSHSLVMAFAWGLVLAALSGWHLARSSFWLLVALVVSHWVLDFFTHAPDLPSWPGDSPRYGLGLWNSIPATLAVEGSVWLAAIVVYLRVRPLQARRSMLAFWSLVGVSTIIWAASPWSPPPPDARTLGWFGLIGWLMIPWAALADGAPDVLKAANLRE
jgi:hypothetical protein